LEVDYTTSNAYSERQDISPHDPDMRVRYNSQITLTLEGLLYPGN